MTRHRHYRALRAAVGTFVIGTVFALWTWGHFTGDPLGTLWDVVILALVIAAGIAVFGRRTFTTALDEANQLQKSDEDNDDT